MGPIQRNGVLLALVLARVSHSSMLFVAVDSEYEVESDRLWITAIGCFFSDERARRLLNSLCAVLGAGEPVTERNAWGVSCRIGQHFYLQKQIF